MAGSGRDPAVSAGELLLRICNKARRKGQLPEEIDLGQVEQLFAIFKTNTSAMNSYNPKPYHGRLILFRGRDRTVDAITRDPALGWSGLAAGPLSIHDIPGAHDTVLQKTGAKAIAGEINRNLSRI